MVWYNIDNMQMDMSLPAKEGRLIEFLRDRWAYTQFTEPSSEPVLLIDADSILNDTGCGTDDLFTICQRLKQNSIIQGYKVDNLGLLWVSLEPSYFKNTRATKSTSPHPITMVGSLAYYSDNTIRFSKTIIPLRKQLVALCRLFLERPNMLVTYDDIKERIIKADKIKQTNYKTIQKYVSALRDPLKKHYRKDMFRYISGDGWVFEPEK